MKQIRVRSFTGITLSLCVLAISLGPGVVSADPVPGEAAQGDQNLSVADRISMERTRVAITKVADETLEESIANLVGVNEFSYPGSAIAGLDPVRDIKFLLCNRRVLKVYAELEELDSKTQAGLMVPAIEGWLADYEKDLLQFNTSQNEEIPDPTEFAPYHDPEGKVSAVGLGYAVQSLVLIGSVLGNAEVLPAFEKVLDSSLATGEISADDYPRDVYLEVTNAPMMPASVAAQAIYQFVRTGVIKKEDVEKLEEDVPVLDLELPVYQSQTSPFDMHAKHGVPVDTSMGVHEFRLLDVDGDAVGRIAESF